jgi:hypothetical protein
MMKFIIGYMLIGFLVTGFTASLDRNYCDLNQGKDCSNFFEETWVGLFWPLALPMELLEISNPTWESRWKFVTQIK